MSEYNLSLEEEKKEIIRKYKNLIQYWESNKGKVDTTKVKQAFKIATKAHENMRRRSGEPYIFHPLEVASIVAKDMGLGETSIICALMHDVVEDSQDYTIEDIENIFGEKVAYIVDGLTKIKDGYQLEQSSEQAENIKKMLLTISDDIRVILIKLADRLHNMRTLSSMPHSKQQDIAAETLYLYAPLAHRLGLYIIKTELEDLALKYNDPEIYKDIHTKLVDSQAERYQFASSFILPIKQKISKEKFQYKIDYRTKSIYSIYQKMKRKGISFEEIYDLFAIRIIIDVPLEEEKRWCWHVYSIVTELYTPKQNRLRDWISTPKPNGYEALHITVMSNVGEWVEVQIRTKRMDEIAEQGYAAHWRYKQIAPNDNAFDIGLDKWIDSVREIITSPDPNAINFVDSFKRVLNTKEVYVWSPKGKLMVLPLGSTALDFAYAIHTDLGNQCIGAKINNRLAPLEQVLQTSDQVEIISSAKSFPKQEWLNFVKTTRAISAIKEHLKGQRVKEIKEGKINLEKRIKDLGYKLSKRFIQRLSIYAGFSSEKDLFYQNYIGNVYDELIHRFHRNVIAIEKSNSKKKATKKENEVLASTHEYYALKDSKNKVLEVDDLNYAIAHCCHPIPGEDIIAYDNQTDEWAIHRTNCTEAIYLMSRFANRINHANWSNKEKKRFLASIIVLGYDRDGILFDILKMISDNLKINIRSFQTDINSQLFKSTLTILVENINMLQDVINHIKTIKDIESVKRIYEF